MIFKSHSNLITHRLRHTYIITYLLNINCNTSTFCTLSNTLLSFLPKYLFRKIKNSFLYSSYLNSLLRSNFHSRFIKFFKEMRRENGAASRRLELHNQPTVRDGDDHYLSRISRPTIYQGFTFSAQIFATTRPRTQVSPYLRRHS